MTDRAVDQARSSLGNWPQHDARLRLLSQLDASTGKLTGQQQRVYADLPDEETLGTPHLANRLVHNADSSVDVMPLWQTPDGPVRPPGGVITVTAAGRLGGAI